MALSCFTPCGLLELSSREPLAETIYKSIQRSFGPAYESENFYGPMSGRWYAKAMAIAAAKKSLERAANQADPHRCSDLLTAHEITYDLPVTPESTLASRHEALAAAMKLPFGPRRGNVEYQLRTALGADFVAWVTHSPFFDPYDPVHTLWFDASYPDPATAPAIWNDPALWKTIVITPRVDTLGSQTVAWTHEAGDEGELLVGDQLIVAPGELGQQEKITVTARTSSTLTAIFARPHEAGAMAIRRPWPFWMSIQKHSLVVVKHGRALDRTIHSKVATLLHKLLGGTSTWDIVEENATAGTTGPFVANQSAPNIHPIRAAAF